MKKQINVKKKTEIKTKIEDGRWGDRTALECQVLRHLYLYVLGKSRPNLN